MEKLRSKIINSALKSALKNIQFLKSKSLLDQVFISLFTLGCLMPISFAFAQSADLPAQRKLLFEKSGKCLGAVTSSDQFMAWTVKSRKSGNDLLVVTSLVSREKILEVESLEKIVDLKIYNQEIFVLSETKFSIYDLEQKKIKSVFPSHPSVMPGSHYSEMATGLIVYNNSVFISHGALGVAVFDLQKEEYTSVIAMQSNSTAQDIELINSNWALVAVDNNDEGQFRGLYLIDLQKRSILRQISVDNAYPSSVRMIDSQRVALNFFNAVWLFDLGTLIGSTKEPQPLKRVWQFPGLFNVDMKGKAFFDSENLYSCFKLVDPSLTQMTIQPLAVSLQSLKLK